MRAGIIMALISTAALVARADLTPAELAAGRSLDHVLVQFHTGALARAGLPARALKTTQVDQLGLPAGARLEESGFARWQRAQAGKASDTLDAERWLYCHRPATQSVDQLLAALKANPLVDYAEPDFVGTGGVAPNDPSFGAQWHHRNNGTTNAVRPDIRSTNAWSITTGSTNVILAVLDTGIATGNVEFAGRLLPGYDYANNDSNPSDDHSHGTAVAGDAAANGNNTNLVAGVDWQCRILPVKVLDSGNSGYYSWWSSGIAFAVAQGADVINLSAGGSTADVTLSNAIMSAINAGVIFVTITHNDSSSTVRFPGRMRPCITVGATTSNDQRASYSNYGPSIDLCAPGSGIQSVHYAGGGYNGNGTSFAAPLVAGAACLLRAMRPDLNQESVRTLLCASADDRVGNPAEDVAGFDNYHGWGRLNGHAALQLALADFAAATNGATAPAFAWEAPANAGQRRPFRVDAAAYPDGPWVTAAAPASITYTSGLAMWSTAGAATSTAARLYRLAVPAL
jgi:thermitase